ncbi:MAG: 23S rRNA (adenine(2503)-C(2))-methyltransferase RlmN [Clostridia bacterium]|nr:23S rRNA (adenine(2503)-C(2))-methyltransferase RlmN [Clostridia bacterium]
MERKDIKSMTKEEIALELAEIGQPKFRAKQIYEWLSKGVDSFEEMTNLSKDLRNALSEKYIVPSAKIARKLVSQIDGTVKYLFSLYDGEKIESVVMSYHHGYTICISTQVGCRMGCVFCATGMNGLKRNLFPGEMLSQITSAEKDLNIRISNVVLMGMGEPLDNYENTLKFLQLVNDDEGKNIGARHISLSTCGLVDKMYDLSNEKLQITLSVSLHAPNDMLRSEMMPINNKWNIEKLLTACKDYTESTKRRISFEYTVVDGVNDSEECAKELAKRLKGMLCHVNLIPLNTVSGKEYKPSQNSKKFCELLNNMGINATIRRTLGSDINASCGQLAGERNS